MENDNNIVLIGFMGVGKGRTARSLAEKTGRFAVDGDDLLVSYAKKKIRKIFKEDGEQHFRELEKKMALWLEKSVRNTIISTGGGFVMVPNLHRLGRVVYLHQDFEALIETITNHPKAEKRLKNGRFLLILMLPVNSTIFVCPSTGNLPTWR